MKNSGKQLVGIILLLAIVLVVFFVNGSNSSNNFGSLVNYRLYNATKSQLEVVSIIDQSKPPPTENGNAQQRVNLFLYSADGIPYYYYYYGGSTPYEINTDSTYLVLNGTGGRQTKASVINVTRETNVMNYRDGRYVRIFNNKNRSNTALLFYVDGYGNWIDNNDKASQNRTVQKCGNVLPLSVGTDYAFGLKTMNVGGTPTVCISQILNSETNIQINNVFAEYRVRGGFTRLNNNILFNFFNFTSSLLYRTITNVPGTDLILSTNNIDLTYKDSPDVLALNKALFYIAVGLYTSNGRFLKLTNTVFSQMGLTNIGIHLVNGNESEVRGELYLNSYYPTNITGPYVNSVKESRYNLYKAMVEYFNNTIIRDYNINYPWKKINNMVLYNLNTRTLSWYAEGVLTLFE